MQEATHLLRSAIPKLEPCAEFPNSHNAAVEQYRMKILVDRFIEVFSNGRTENRKRRPGRAVGKFLMEREDPFVVVPIMLPRLPYLAV